MSKIIIDNRSETPDEEVIGYILKTMTEHKKFKRWVEDGQVKKIFVGYFRSEYELPNIVISPSISKTGTIKFDVF